MSTWCHIIIDRLEAMQGGLANAAGLRMGMDGEEFEEALGAFLRWQSSLPDTARFLAFGGSPPGSLSGPVNEWMGQSSQRGESVIEAIHASLFEQFGASAVDATRAARAYETLFTTLSKEIGTITIATTNYDFSAELGIAKLGRKPIIGRQADSLQTPRLEPRGILDRAEAGDVPVLHLHGGVGWYRSGDQILCQGIEQPYNSTLGQPALLLPDPNKDPASAAGVSALWDEFDLALRRASHVLVVGHSLHDATLVERLRITAARKGVALAISFFEPDDDSPAEEREAASAERERLRNLTEAATIGLRFGPDLHINSNDLRAWLGMRPLPPSMRAKASS